MHIFAPSASPRPATSRPFVCRALMVVALGLGFGCDADPALDVDELEAEDFAHELDMLCGEIEDEQLLTCVRDLTQAPAAEPPSEDPVTSSRIGEVVAYSLEHGFGRIESGRTQHIYVHRSELEPGLSQLEPGDIVRFELTVEGDGFKWAQTVELAD